MPAPGPPTLQCPSFTFSYLPQFFFLPAPSLPFPVQGVQWGQVGGQKWAPPSDLLAEATASVGLMVGLAVSGTSPHPKPCCQSVQIPVTRWIHSLTQDKELQQVLGSCSQLTVSLPVGRACEVTLPQLQGNILARNPPLASALAL